MQGLTATLSHAVLQPLAGTSDSLLPRMMAVRSRQDQFCTLRLDVPSPTQVAEATPMASVRADP
jgi:hypothetical protein